jgi:hypothetical protein
LREKNERRADRSNALRTIGTIGGAVVGGAYGGPGGAVVGSQIGNTAGGMVASMSGGERVSSQEVAQTGVSAFAFSERQKQREQAEQDEIVSFRTEQQPVLDQSGQPTGQTVTRQIGINRAGERVPQTNLVSRTQVDQPATVQQDPRVSQMADKARGRAVQLYGPRLEASKAMDNINQIENSNLTPKEKIDAFNKIVEPVKFTKVTTTDEQGRQVVQTVPTIQGKRVGEPQPLTQKRGIKQSQVDQNLTAQIALGVVDQAGNVIGIPQDGRLVVDSGTPPRKTVFGPSEGEKQQIAQLDRTQFTPQQFKGKVRQINPSAFTGTGVDTVAGVEQLPPQRQEVLQGINDSPELSPQENINKGVGEARKQISLDIESNVAQTPRNSEARLAALENGVTRAIRAGDEKKALNLNSRAESLAQKLGVERRREEVEAKKGEGLDRVIKRRLLEQEKATRESLQNVGNLERLYSQDFLTLKGRAGIKTTLMADRAIGLRDPQTGELTVFGEFVEALPGTATLEEAINSTKFDRALNREFNAYRKDITGAQASYKEIKFLEKALFSTANSPEEFKAALAEYRKALVRKDIIVKDMLNNKEYFMRDTSGEVITDANGKPQFDINKYNQKYLTMRNNEIFEELKADNPGIDENLLKLKMERQLRLEELID